MKDTPDDWWNEGFEDFFDGAGECESDGLPEMARENWRRGYWAAFGYKMRGLGMAAELMRPPTETVR